MRYFVFSQPKSLITPPQRVSLVNSVHHFRSQSTHRHVSFYNVLALLSLLIRSCSPPTALKHQHTNIPSAIPNILVPLIDNGRPLRPFAHGIRDPAVLPHGIGEVVMIRALHGSTPSTTTGATGSTTSTGSMVRYHPLIVTNVALGLLSGAALDSKHPAITMGVAKAPPQPGLSLSAACRT